MILLSLIIAVVLCLSASLTFIRLVKGPTVADRIVSANAAGIMLFSVILLLCYSQGAVDVLDVALVYAILQFADVLIMAKYLGRKDVEESNA